MFWLKLWSNAWFWDPFPSPTVLLQQLIVIRLIFFLSSHFYCLASSNPWNNRFFTTVDSHLLTSTLVNVYLSNLHATIHYFYEHMLYSVWIFASLVAHLIPLFVYSTFLLCMHSFPSVAYVLPLSSKLAS